MKIYDYSKLRPDNITSERYRHTLLLLFWPIYGLVFLSLERFLSLTYHPVECALDSHIPFCELFVIPYYFWFAYIFWIILYSFFFDIPAFKKFSWFVIITYTATCIIYLIYPTQQLLRPESFERDNLFTFIVGKLYAFDTNTNVCPSLHVIGSMAVTFTAWHSKRYSTPLWRIAFVIMCTLINLSTVFLKQHSAIDIATGLLLSFAVYPFIFLKKDKSKKQEAPQREPETATK